MPNPVRSRDIFPDLKCANLQFVKFSEVIEREREKERGGKRADRIYYCVIVK